jgi:hypothetical protein
MHRNCVAGKRQRGAEKQQVANILRSTDCAAATPDDPNDACRNERESNSFLPRKFLLQDDRCKQGYHQRHHAGKERARV